MKKHKRWQAPSPKKARQMIRRGWSNSDVQDVLDNPVFTSKNVNKATGYPATYYYRADGHYVVHDDVTGDIFHVSDIKASVWIDPNTNKPIKPFGSS